MFHDADGQSTISIKASNPPRAPKAHQTSYAVPEEAKYTSIALTNISRALLRSVNQILDSRDTLKKRWDADRGLQLQTVTDDLAELNDHFIRSEEVLRDCIALIQDRLLKR